MRNVAPVTLTLPPELIERASRIAEAEARSRSYVVARALQVYCDSIEIPLGATMAGASVDAAAGTRAPSGQPAAPSFNESAPMPEPNPAEATRREHVMANHTRGIAAMQRQAEASRANAADHAAEQQRVARENESYLRAMGKGGAA